MSWAEARSAYTKTAGSLYQAVGEQKVNQGVVPHAVAPAAGPAPHEPAPLAHHDGALVVYLLGEAPLVVPDARQVVREAATLEVVLVVYVGPVHCFCL